MKPLSKGDTVKVRLFTGEVVEAVYDDPMESMVCEKHHFVEINGRSMVAGKYGNCRFVGPSCDLLPVGVTV